MSTFTKYPGNKQSLVSDLEKHDLIPKTETIIEPFAGSMAVSLHNIRTNKSETAIANDINYDLIKIYQLIRDSKDELKDNILPYIEIWEKLQRLSENFAENLTYNKFKNDNWKRAFLTLEREIPVIDGKSILHTIIKSKIRKKRKYLLRQENKGKYKNIDDDYVRLQFKRAFMGGFYYYFRDWVRNTDPTKEAIRLIFIYELSYASMMRYSKTKKRINIPFGQYIDKNLRDIYDRIDTFHELFQSFQFKSHDFQKFSTTKIEDGFFFIDPPYHNSWSKYNNKPFDENDHLRLVNTIEKISKNNKFLLMVNDDPFYRTHYKEFTIDAIINKKYRINIRNRNNRDIDYLCIHNLD